MITSTSPLPTPVAVTELVEGDLTATLTHDGERLLLSATHNGAPAIDPIELGITVNGEALTGTGEITGIHQERIAETYTAYTGKATGTRTVDHAERHIELRSPRGTEWTLILRLGHDGLAFRYQIGTAGAVPADTLTLGTELTRISLEGAERTWVLDYQTWYETPRVGVDLADLAPGDYGFPLLVSRPGGAHVLWSESDIDATNSGAHPVFTREGGPALLVTPADPTLSILAGHRTPWRVAIIGSLAQVVASTLVDDLAPAPSGPITAPRPGRAAWSWWSSQYSGAYLSDQKRFTEYAAEQGWEHVLVDCGWDETWVPELVAFAAARGIQVHLWSSWSDLDGAEALSKLERWRNWGVAGIKVDFMESEGNRRYRWYDAILRESARVGLMVNFHGSVIPRGWAKTYPHVVSYEGIRGAEYYVFYGNPLSAAHNVIQPFTRNVVGAMDYTPVTFSAPERETSDGHELALGIVYESGITHFADDPDRYRERPLANRFLAELPATWHETRLLGGDPDSHALIARRHGDAWYLGAIATGAARTLSLPIGELTAGGPAAGNPAAGNAAAGAQPGAALDIWLVTDGPDNTLEETLLSAHDGEAIDVPVATNGGFVAIAVPAGTPLLRAKPRTVLPEPTVEPRVAAITAGGTATLHTEPGARIRITPGWSALPAGDNERAWTITAPASASAGDTGVVTVELPGTDGVPRTAHARFVLPFGEGEHPLSDAPFLSCHNEVGPVERNESNGGGDPHDGTTLTVAGTAYPSGLGVSHNSAVTFYLGGSASTLFTAVAVDDETPDAAAQVSIEIDGTEHTRLTLRSGEAPHDLEIPVAGAHTLTLRTQPLDGAATAHIDWLNPRLQS
ncbi:glycoside hydrolase family 97 catalytic domain-containing protein [Mycetocola saprophilus]|uniref:glycoside hydrolase family 97 catalytic domain-containing protein n=1 Tax=Mycetocola saprophilus TaxID=76636 RepID=UPI0004C1A6FE|nr:glycoside hydrolase family 97 catalytic domain-containing protein [Mycetocola saprophilus]